MRVSHHKSDRKLQNWEKSKPAELFLIYVWVCSVLNVSLLVALYCNSKRTGFPLNRASCTLTHLTWPSPLNNFWKTASTFVISKTRLNNIFPVRLLVGTWNDLHTKINVEQHHWICRLLLVRTNLAAAWHATTYEKHTRDDTNKQPPETGPKFWMKSSVYSPLSLSEHTHWSFTTVFDLNVIQ